MLVPERYYGAVTIITLQKTEGEDRDDVHSTRGHTTTVPARGRADHITT